MTTGAWRGLLSLGAVLLWMGRSDAAEVSASAESRQIRYGFTIQNTRGDLLPVAELWVYGPAERTSIQRLRDLRASHPHEGIPDSVGNRILHFAFTNLPPYAVRVVTIEADVELRDPSAGTDVPAGMDGGSWLGSEPCVEIDDPDFVRMAPRIAGTNAVDKARSVFAWVTTYLKDDGYSARDRGAMHALRAKKGDCTEFMYLFVALCRRAGIPARGIGGYLCPRSMVVRSTDFHNWAEFFDGERWRIADPYRKSFMPKSPDYVATRIVGGADGLMGGFPRFRYQGEGLKVTMN